MYQVNGRIDKVYRRLNGLHRRRQREAAGGKVVGGKYVHTTHRMDLVDELLTIGMDVLEGRHANSEKDGGVV